MSGKKTKHPPPGEVVDIQVEELAERDASAEHPARGLAVVPRPPAEREVLMPLDAQQVVDGMRQYQQLLRDLLEPSEDVASGCRS